MCLILFAWRVHPQYPLVVAANRDEFYTRPSEPAAFWDAPPGATPVLAGRDLQAGGTWLGVTATGRFAAVTNIRDPSQAELKPRSRGELTRNFLAGDLSAAQYSQQLRASFSEYAGYNLLLGDGQELVYLNNFSARVETLQPGIYGLSNGQLNSDWPKVQRGRARLAQLLDDKGPLQTDSLLALMTDRQQAEDSQLPDTGIPRELERKLSSAFIFNPERLYGTCCSSAVIQSSDGCCRFSEQNFDARGQATSCHFFELPARDRPALAHTG